MTIAANFSPSPVSVTTPTMMPAQAQVAATLQHLHRAASSAATSRRGAPARSRGEEATAATATTVAQSTERIGEKPEQQEHDDRDQREKW